MMPNPLLPTFQDSSEESDRLVHLVCVPHAGGGSAAFFRWRAQVSDWLNVIPIQLPGREGRIREPLYESIEQLVLDLADAVAPLTDLPFALLGNSMGAIIAFELACELRRRALPPPKMLIVAACRAPQLIKTPTNPLAELDDEQFVSTMSKQYGGIPAEVSQNEELLDLVLPILRADIAMLEAYEYKREAPLEVEILAMGGSQDSALSVTDINAWREQTSGRFSARMDSGGHFFLTDASANSPSSVLRLILQRLQQYR